MARPHTRKELVDLGIDYTAPLTANECQTTLHCRLPPGGHPSVCFPFSSAADHKPGHSSPKPSKDWSQTFPHTIDITHSNHFKSGMTEMEPVPREEKEVHLPRPATEQSLTSLQSPGVPLTWASRIAQDSHNGQYLRPSVGESPSQEASASRGCETT